MSLLSRLIQESRMKLANCGVSLITSKVLDARRRGAIEGNAAEPVPAKAGMMP